ncbi:hypothetical protein LXA47_30655, partial [Massilia sp. P8910]|uniref:hypothetical protein n=1 Tax=Massilia antarctica TaxID=2765360 RepID=UPI001E5625F3
KVFAAISILGTVFTLVGYGVAVSVDSSFDIPHQSLYSSAIELLSLSVWGVLEIFNASSHLDFLNNYVIILRQLLPAFLVAFATIAAYVIYLKYWHSRPSSRRSLPHWLERVLATPSATDSSSTLIFKFSALASAILVSLPLLILAVIICAIFSVAVLAIPSTLGIAAGSAHIKEYVVGPVRCAPLIDRKSRMAPRPPVVKNPEKLATCL